MDRGRGGRGYGKRRDFGGGGKGRSIERVDTSREETQSEGSSPGGEKEVRPFPKEGPVRRHSALVNPSNGLEEKPFLKSTSNQKGIRFWPGISAVGHGGGKRRGAFCGVNVPLRKQSVGAVCSSEQRRAFCSEAGHRKDIEHCQTGYFTREQERKTKSAQCSTDYKKQISKPGGEAQSHVSYGSLECAQTHNHRQHFASRIPAPAQNLGSQDAREGNSSKFFVKDKWSYQENKMKSESTKRSLSENASYKDRETSSLSDAATKPKKQTEQSSAARQHQKQLGKKSTKKGDTGCHRTEGVLQIKYFFLNAESVHDTVWDNFSEDDAKLEFKESGTWATKERAVCKIVLHHTEKSSGENIFVKLCERLKHSLKTEVMVCDMVTLGEGNADDAKEKQKMVHCDMDESCSESAHSKDTKQQKRRTNRKRSKRSKLNTTEDVVGSDAAAQKINNGNEAKNAVPSPVPTTMDICIERNFEDTDSLLRYLQEQFGKEKYSYEVVHNSIDLRRFKTFCKMRFPSKAAARRFTGPLNKLKEVNIWHGQTSAEKARTERENEIHRSRILTHIQTMSELMSSHILKHEAKMKTIEDTIANLCQNSNKHTAKRNQCEISALEDKLEEAARQKGTFKDQCEKMIDKLNNLSESAMSHEVEKKLLRSLSIECNRLSNALPMYGRRDEILSVLSSNQVSIIIGETGSGKSTQMAQYICESGSAGKGLTVCTQPRKIAARTLAERVAFETASKVGKLVGYKTGAMKCVSSETRIIFTTDHSLLNDFLQDPDLSAYSCIIVDEAHERSIYTDILLGMIKSCLQRRPDLKVVITSATIDPEVFMNYFPKKPGLLHVSGRTFPVDVVYESTDETQDFENLEEKVLSKVVDIHRSGVTGDILVFLTSAVEIMRCCEEVKKRLKDKDYVCFPLHGQLPPEEQQKVFKPLERGKRKIVFSTNCAETSVTIDGIKFVVDTGVAKEMRYDPKKNISLLGTHVISQSSANQRKGRAGRTSSGTCYRLYSEDSFLSMTTSSQPEILKVHLGQAVLKLAELGVNARSYDFVESPSEEALDTAVHTLREIGALEGSTITRIGRWISKLSFDPRQGYLVFLGNEDGLLYDALVIAALLSNGSDVFYRGLTEVDEQNSAKNKNQFASPYGDPFTCFKVYQEWCSLPKKQQSSWCMEHSVNYKVLNYTRQCVKEVSDVLRKEHGIQMVENFSTAETAVDRLRKMIFRANLSMIGHYLGHHRAGYYATGIHRQVHFHPSSSLVCQNAHPEWIVYSQFVKTSRDFIKSITVIDEAWVQEMAQENLLSFDIAEVKKKQTLLVHQEEAGTIVFRALVGPRYQNLLTLEDQLTQSGMETVVVEANRDVGTLNIFSSSAPTQKVTQVIDSLKKGVVEDLQVREQEFPVKKASSREQTGCRVTLGKGAAITSVFMPRENNKILIQKASDTSTVQDMKKKFSAYGEIKDCFPFKSGFSWGLIRFATCSEAENAVAATKNDDTNVAVLLKTDQNDKHKASQFQARLSWYRRPVKGKGTAFIKCSDKLKEILIGRELRLNLGYCLIKMSDKGNDLVCFNTGSTSEELIKEIILSVLTARGLKTENLKDEIRVSVVRERKDCPTEEQMNNLKEGIQRQFNRYLHPPQDSCTVDLKPVRSPADIKQVAFIHFNNPVSGFRACRRLQGSLCVEDATVEISPELKTSINIPKAIMEANKERFTDLINGLKRYKGTEVAIVSLKRGDFRLDICSKDAERIVEARGIFQTELDGEVIECGRAALLESLLTQRGVEAVRAVERTENVLIIINHREKQLHIYGANKDITAAQMGLNKYLSRLVDGKEECIHLKGPFRPPGLMKELILKYGHTLDGLREQFGLNNIKVDFKCQKISIVGKDEALKACMASIEELSRFLAERLNTQADQELPDCVVCMCPVESCSYMYRAQGCGHCYCLDCLKQQMVVAVDEKQLPIACAKEDCGKLLVWKDFEFVLNKKWVAPERLVQMSLNAFVGENPGKFKFCSTANCPIVYRVTPNPDGCVFICPSCYASVCSSCGKASHTGLTCHMMQSVSHAERELEEWARKDPGKRQVCPGCRSPIEKIEGCNKMKCTACKTYFCWLCKASFHSEDQCYKHLRKEHGGFY